MTLAGYRGGFPRALRAPAPQFVVDGSSLIDCWPYFACR
jgi:hypothetical protein